MKIILANRRLNESYSILDVFDLCHMGFMTIKRQKTKSQLSYKSMVGTPLLKV